MIRLVSIWPYRHQGTDAYYFLLSVEAFKEQKRIPVKLPPYYLADIEEQWYPPGFTVFLSLFPDKILRRYYWIINSIVDFANLLLLDVLLYLNGVPFSVLLTANMFYIFIPVFNIEYFNLNSRPLGNLFFSLFIIAMFAFMHMQGLSLGGVVLFFLLWIAWILILLTHKLTMQCALFVSIVLSVVSRSFVPLLIVLGGIPFCVILTRGFYWKVLKGHGDILKFWDRHIDFLGAHQVYDSPIYGEERYQEIIQKKTKVFLRSIPDKLRQLLFYNPFIYFVLYVCFFNNDLISSGFQKYLVIIVCSVLSWSVLTTFIPFLRFLGEGYKYLKYSGLPSAALIATVFPQLTGGERTAIFCLFILSLASMIKAAYNRWKKSANISLISGDFKDLLDYLKAHKDIDDIGCMSLHMSDAVVYFSRKRVLWGTHHYLFNEKVVKFFPVLRKTREDISKEFQLKYWCINKDYVEPECLGFNEKDIEVTFGTYSLYKG